jgi:cystathionine gamma-lyase
VCGVDDHGHDGDDGAAGRFATRAISSAAGAGRPAAGVSDVVTPIHLSTTFRRPGIDPAATLDDIEPAQGEYVYGRLSNPTRHRLERRLASVCGGEHAAAFGSGTAAVATLVAACVEPGDHVVAFDDLYGGTKSLLARLFGERLGVDVTLADATDPGAVAAATRPETTLLWMETPTNPLMRLCDVEALSAVADDAGARLVVDNTFASPYFQRPLDLGADAVVHSTTKYVNGHSDSVGGAAVTDDPELFETVSYLQQVGLGNAMSPFDAFLVARGLKTLAVRMERHETNATAVAERLAADDRVRAVHYPGLESHPQHELASRQMSGYGGTLSFDLATDADGVARFVAALEHVPLAVSLGGVESLIEHPASMTHSPLSAAERAELGIGDSLLRLSVGIEDRADLLADVERGLAAV